MNIAPSNAFNEDVLDNEKTWISSTLGLVDQQYTSQEIRMDKKADN